MVAERREKEIVQKNMTIAYHLDKKLYCIKLAWIQSVQVLFHGSMWSALFRDVAELVFCQAGAQETFTWKWEQQSQVVERVSHAMKWS